MKKSFYKKIPKYYIVSLSSVGVNLWLYLFLINHGFNYLIAAIIGFILETIITYLSNRLWTFSNTLIDFKIGYLRSFLVATFNLTLILALTALNKEVLQMNYLLARIVAGIIVGIISFILDAKFSFAVWPNTKNLIK